MPSFGASDGTRLAYLVEGEGTPVVLLHGAGASAWLNWIATGWAALLVGGSGLVGIVQDQQSAQRVERERASTAEHVEPGGVDGQALVGREPVDPAAVFLSEEELVAPGIDDEASQGGVAGIGERDPQPRLAGEVDGQLVTQVDPVELGRRVAGRAEPEHDQVETR